MKVAKVIGQIILGLVAVCIVIMLAYLTTGHYDASNSSILVMENMAVEYDDYYEIDKGSDKGFIFYPGAKVDARSYSYLKDVNADVYIAKFPFEMAFFNMNVADKIIEENSDNTSWYIGGHSLGGVAASLYGQENNDIISGIVYLASYPADEIVDESIRNLSIYGTNDMVVGDYTEKKDLFNENTTFLELDGGTHSQFGDYGIQKGDGTPEMKIEKQHNVTVEAINKFII